MRTSLCLLFVLGLPALVAAQQADAAVAGSAATTGADPAAAPASTDFVPSGYTVDASDVLDVRVFQEPDLDRQVRVGRDGEITLPLIGRLLVAGKTVDQIEAEIRRLYDQDYLVNPQVNVTVVQYARRYVIVSGAVNAPQEVPFPPEEQMTLMEAVVRAGGLSRLARRSQIRLVRSQQDGSTETFTINADDIISGKDKRPWFLQKGDIIHVPEIIL